MTLALLSVAFAALLAASHYHGFCVGRRRGREEGVTFASACIQAQFLARGILVRFNQPQAVERKDAN